jgi:hypothetical protein
MLMFDCWGFLCVLTEKPLDLEDLLTMCSVYIVTLLYTMSILGR